MFQLIRLHKNKTDILWKFDGEAAKTLGANQSVFSGGGMDIFWNHTIRVTGTRTFPFLLTLSLTFRL